MTHTPGLTPLVMVDAKTWRKVRDIEPASKVLIPWWHECANPADCKHKRSIKRDIGPVTPAMRARYGG